MSKRYRIRRVARLLVLWLLVRCAVGRALGWVAVQLATIGARFQGPAGPRTREALSLVHWEARSGRRVDDGRWVSVLGRTPLAELLGVEP